MKYIIKIVEKYKDYILLFKNVNLNIFEKRWLKYNLDYYLLSY